MSDKAFAASFLIMCFGGSLLSWKFVHDESSVLEGFFFGCVITLVGLAFVAGLVWSIMVLLGFEMLSSLNKKCILCHGTGYHSDLQAILPGQPMVEPQMVMCMQCTVLSVVVDDEGIKLISSTAFIDAFDEQSLAKDIIKGTATIGFNTSTQKEISQRAQRSLTNFISCDPIEKICSLTNTIPCDLIETTPKAVAEARRRRFLGKKGRW